MSQRCVESVLGRLITDAAFREQFFLQPETVCRDQSLDDLTATELSALLNVNPREFEVAAVGLDPRIVRAAIIVQRGETRSSNKSQSAPNQRRRRQGGP